MSVLGNLAEDCQKLRKSVEEEIEARTIVEARKDAKNKDWSTSSRGLQYGVVTDSLGLVVDSLKQAEGYLDAVAKLDKRGE